MPFLGFFWSDRSDSDWVFVKLTWEKVGSSSDQIGSDDLFGGSVGFGSQNVGRMDTLFQRTPVFRSQFLSFHF